MDVRLSEAELEVMEVLWAASQPLGATDVASAVENERNWSLATVKTLLSRSSRPRTAAGSFSPP